MYVSKFQVSRTFGSALEMLYVVALRKVCQKEEEIAIHVLYQLMEDPLLLYSGFTEV